MVYMNLYGCSVSIGHQNFKFSSVAGIMKLV